jgi:hypothetical protein
MIAGISGSMLSSGYLDRIVGDEQRTMPPEFDAWARAVVRWWRRTQEVLGPASPPRLVFDVGARPLLDLLGYAVEQVERQEWGHAALLAGGGTPLAALLHTAWGTPASAAWRQALRSSLAVRLPWALVFSGDSLAVVDGTRPWNRRQISFDLEVVCRDRRAVQALWALARAEALCADRSPAPLARAMTASDAEGVAVCATLGHGVLDALGELISAFDAAPSPGVRRRSPRDASLVFEQSLTIVYRLLFLLFAEARQLVPVWHRVYRESYSVDALCRRLMLRPQARGVWAAVQAMSRLAHTGCVADDLRVTAFNGRLFAPARAPLAEQVRLPDAAAARAVLSLGTSASPEGRRRIAFDDLGVEQLGAVYERVLEYEPVRQQARLALGRTSTERKITGSFYTPRAVTDFLVRRTLGPLVDGLSADGILKLRVIDPAMGSGAFLVAACRYLTERAEQALVAEGAWTARDIVEADRADLARAIAEQCLYGIDRNATAVQLARLSLWLTTLAANRPLTFLDHHLAVGNSLVGTRLSDLAHPTPPRNHGDQRHGGDRQLLLFDGAALERLGRTVMPERLRLSLTPSTTPLAVREKERRLDRLLADDGVMARWVRAADLWCGLVLNGSQGVGAGLYQELLRHVSDLPTTMTARQCEAAARPALQRARAHGACHWELLFPEVFLSAGGEPRDDAGFDAVLGNPPWEMLRADTGDCGRRADTREETRALMRFVRASGHYPLQGHGHVNQYQLFAERVLHALRPGGRFGLILPSGIQTDVGSAGLRRALVDTCAIDTWLGFDNRRAIFPIHRGVRFVVLAGSRGAPGDVIPIASGLTDADVLHRLPDRAGAGAGVPVVPVSRIMLHRWDPAHLTIPSLASPLDASIAWRAMSSPALSSGRGWHVHFGRELNATDDASLFVPREPTVAGAAVAGLPVVDGRHLRPFGVDLAGIGRVIDRDAAAQRLACETSFDRPRVCYRDVASVSNRLTLIAARLPAGVVSTHTVFCAKEALSPADTWCLVALLNSLVANYLVRLQMTTHVTTTLMARLPVPRPACGSEVHASLAALADSLSSGPFEDQHDDYARLNALAARAYGLAADEYTHVVATFPLLTPSLRARCVDLFGAWR